jgi:hypothetical protein
MHTLDLARGLVDAHDEAVKTEAQGLEGSAAVAQLLASSGHRLRRLLYFVLRLVVPTMKVSLSIYYALPPVCSAAGVHRELSRLSSGNAGLYPAMLQQLLIVVSHLGRRTC